MSGVDKQELTELLAHVFTVRAAVAEKHGKYQRGKSADVRDTMPCPKCGATLHYSRAAYNGHIWGRCETKGCLAWME